MIDVKTDISAKSVAKSSVLSTTITDVKSMQELTTRHPEALKALKAGDVVSGTILSAGKNEVYMLIPSIGMGVVRGRELYDDKVYLQNLKPGSEIMASVLDPDNKDGLVELSFRQAGHERVWSTLREKLESKETIETKILDANKGGLLVEINGVTGFLPVSQLTISHYPKIKDGDKNKILQELKKFIGQEFKVKAIDVNQNENKIVISEKEAGDEEFDKAISKYKAGDIVKGMLQHSRSSSGTKEPTDINALADEYLRLAYHGTPLRPRGGKYCQDIKGYF